MNSQIEKVETSGQLAANLSWQEKDATFGDSALYAAAAQLSMAPLNVPVIWRGQEPAFAVAVKSATSLPQALCAYGLLSLLDAASDSNISATNN
jgi:hypothetical protein